MHTNSKTWIIACVSPAEICVDETLSTLKFVRFAKLVKNVATVNQDRCGMHIYMLMLA